MYVQEQTHVLNRWSKLEGKAVKVNKFNKLKRETVTVDKMLQAEAFVGNT